MVRNERHDGAMRLLRVFERVEKPPDLVIHETHTGPVSPFGVPCEAEDRLDCRVKQIYLVGHVAARCIREYIYALRW